MNGLAQSFTKAGILPRILFLGYVKIRKLNLILFDKMNYQYFRLEVLGRS